MALRITARMYIGTPSGCLGLRGAAARRSATWPFALVGLRATSHTCDSLYEMHIRLPQRHCSEVFWSIVFG